MVLTTPILEGLDGVQKMSKSLGNAIGIHEPPLEMYGKIMSISDEMMWRYYELLTDVSLAEIEKMKSETHPMVAKKELARRIRADFHSEDAAIKAGEDWGRQFQKSEVPESVERVTVQTQAFSLEPQEAGHSQRLESSQEPPPGKREVHIRLDKVLHEIGLAASRTEAGRKIKEKAVRVDDQIILGIVVVKFVPTDIAIRVGKKVKIVELRV